MAICALFNIALQYGASGLTLSVHVFRGSTILISTYNIRGLISFNRSLSKSMGSKTHELQIHEFKEPVEHFPTTPFCI